MSSCHLAAEVGLINPVDLEILRRFFDATSIFGETEQERDDRAARLIHLFAENVANEAALIALVKAGRSVD